MNTAHVVSGLDRRSGGVAAAVVTMAAAQARAGLGVRVLSTFTADEDPHPAAAELAAAGVGVTLAGPIDRRLIGRHPQTASAVARVLAGVDVLHVHALWEDVQHQAMRHARATRLPYVVSPHGMLATWSMRQRSLKKKLYLAWRLRGHLDAANALHFTTDEEARQVAPLGLRPPALVEALGLDLAEFAGLPPPGTFRGRYPELTGRPVVLFMSRLHAKKGLDLLIPAFADAGGDARLVLAGPDEGGYERTVRELVARHGLTGRATFTGMLHGRDRIAALADADVFVLPSYQENFGIVVPEALAAATPVIVSDQVNFCEHLAGRGFADVVPCAVGPLATAIGRRLADPAARRRDGDAARAWAMDRFDWAAIAPRWHAHYARVAGRPAAPFAGTTGPARRAAD